MAAMVSEESAVGRSLEELSNGQRCQSGDSLVEWRTEPSDQSTPSTSPPYWDTDDSDDDGGPKPSELYGKHTWKIDKFSQINKRELRSNAFEVGGYKWYILIYPQGCDVCNHLSLFLCVANHDKLLPGWSHFAQFTIAVVNKDPKKSKYSDTLHRFWKKEHDWGWKKFMELSKVSDGFVDADTLIIKAQVQVIREKAERPFRCLDCQYRRELVRVYLTNVEQHCRRFVEERRGKLGKLIEDKARWSSFCAFWLGMDQNARRRMSREKKDMILKLVVKHFFIEKEVTSTLVMDSLYSGLKALEGQSKGSKGKGKLLEGEDTPAPIVQVEKDTFVLVDDILLLLERAAMEPLPPKDEKGPQNRTKDGANGEEFNKDSIERDERRLTELGRRTVEIFVLAHIFSNKIEVAYQEAVALKRQEELIREEEAAGQAETEQKAKRGAEKDKKKKKQAKAKRNNRKGKDKVKEEKPVVLVQDKQLSVNLAAEGKDLAEPQTMPEKDDALDDASDVSDSVECPVDVLQLDSEDRDASPVNWDTDTSEIHPPAEPSGSDISSLSVVQNGGDKRSSAVMDDSSSTCSTDSAPSVVTNGSYRSNSFTNHKSRKSPIRGKNQRGKTTYEGNGGASGAESRQFEPADARRQTETSSSWKTVESSESEAAIASLQDRTKWPELSAVKKDDEVVLLQRKPSKKDPVDIGPSKEKTPTTPHLSKSPPRNTTTAPAVPPSSDLKSAADSVPAARKVSSNEQQPTDKTTTASASANTSQAATASQPDSSTKTSVPKSAEKPNGQQQQQQQQQAAALSRPSSAPLIPGNLTPLSRSISAAGRLGNNDPSPTAHPYIPQSYRNAIMGVSGNSLSPSSTGFTTTHSATAVVNTSSAFSQQPGLVHAPVFLPQSSATHERTENNRVTVSSSISEEVALSNQQWMGPTSRGLMFDSPSFDLYHRPVNNGIVGGSQEFFPTTGTSGRQIQGNGALADEFPHLDIINDLLLDDEQGNIFQGLNNPNPSPSPSRSPNPNPSLFNQRQFSYPTDMNLPGEVGSLGGGSCRFDRSRSLPEDGYCSSSSPYSSVRDYIPQGAASLAFMNGQIDNGLMQNQWQLLGPDLSLLGLRNSGVDGYQYNVQDYSDLACGVNGYTMFRPSNGH